MAFGASALLMMTFGIVLAKPVLDQSPVLWATTIRQVGAMGTLLIVALLPSQRGACVAVYRPSPSWRFMLPGAVLGSYLSLIFWIAGMKYTETTTASVLNQSSNVFVIFLATLFLKERLTVRKLIAIQTNNPFPNTALKFKFIKTKEFGGRGELYVNGKQVDTVEMPDMHISTYSLAETFDVGRDTGTQVSKRYDDPFPFTGELDRVIFELQDEEGEPPLVPGSYR